MNVNDVLRYGVAGMLVLASGCTHYYRVSDPAGSKLYYTTDIDTTDSGAVKIKDEKTGANVILQSSEVLEISREEYERELKGQPPKLFLSIRMGGRWYGYRAGRSFACFSV
jgi:hypothetical protein